MAVLVPVVHKSLLLLTSLLTCCSKGPQADLQYIKEARSAAAEWALVNEQSNKGTVTATYVRSMHQWLRQELTSSQSAISAQDSRYGEEIRTLLAQPDDAAPEELRSHADVLKNIEDGIEST
jgi:hypothetical protein